MRMTTPISLEDCAPSHIIEDDDQESDEAYNNNTFANSDEMEVKKEDLEHAVGALLSMPSSPMPGHALFSTSSIPSTPISSTMSLPPAPSATLVTQQQQSIPWDDNDDQDIFSLFLDGMQMDDAYLYSPDQPEGGPPLTLSTAAAQQHVTPPFTPNQLTGFDQVDGGAIAAAPAPNTGYTWADALTNTEISSSFIFNSSLPDEFLPASTYSSPMTYTLPLPPLSVPPPPPSTHQQTTLFPPTAAARKRPLSATAPTPFPKPRTISSAATTTTTAFKPIKIVIPPSARGRTISANSLSEDEDGHAGNSHGNNSKGGQPLSPKSHAIREKNREAVRKCRQKKREREDAVAERIALLEQENEELKIQLRLGSPDRAKEVELETKRRAQRIQDLLSALQDTPQAHAELREACHAYIVHSVERSGDRAAATSGTLSRISRLIDPTLFAKFYLWHGTTRDDYFTNPNGLWASISREMSVTDAQTLQLTMRRDKLESLRAEIMDVSCKLADLQSHVALREAADVHDANFVNQIQAQMSPVQLAKFILWLRKDKTVRQVLKPTDVLSSFLTQVMKVDPPPVPLPPPLPLVAAAMTTASPQAVAFAPPPMIAFKKPTLEMNRERVMLLTKGLWDGPKESLEKMAESGFDPSVVLIDPNNGGEYHGIHKMLQYVHRIRLAFGEKITVDLREMSLENDKARATWVLHGTYRGKLNANTGGVGKKLLKHVSFVIVCTYTFLSNSSLVKEMLVSWDAIGLMRQIGLLRGTPKQQQADATATQSSIQQQNSARKRLRTSELGELEEITALERKHVEMLAKLFSSSSEEELARIAEDILDPECVFQDSYMGFEFRGIDQCKNYCKKILTPFKSLNVTSATLREEVEGGGAALGSPLRLNWQIKAIYSGPLVKEPSPCSFSAVLFVGFEDDYHKISSCHFSWAAQRLMDQLKNKATQ